MSRLSQRKLANLTSTHQQSRNQTWKFPKSWESNCGTFQWTNLKQGYPWTTMMPTWLQEVIPFQSQNENRLQVPFSEELVILESWWRQRRWVQMPVTPPLDSHAISCKLLFMILLSPSFPWTTANPCQSSVTPTNALTTILAWPEQCGLDADKRPCYRLDVQGWQLTWFHVVLWVPKLE